MNHLSRLTESTAFLKGFIDPEPSHKSSISFCSFKILLRIWSTPIIFWPSLKVIVYSIGGLILFLIVQEFTNPTKKPSPNSELSTDPS